ncbi:MAG: hypothetical protein RL514_15 [Verrucomicrobiota bacterium]|jgi:CheY-like chemotaxis protein
MKPKHILIVDDEASFTRLLKVNLERHTQHTITVVNRPHEAIPAAHKEKPDLILLDVIMPGQDGGDLAVRMQADPLLRDVPIVFLTATVSQTEAHRGVKSGGFTLLAKPVSMSDLLACLAHYLGPTVANTGPGTQPPPGNRPPDLNRSPALGKPSVNQAPP